MYLTKTLNNNKLCIWICIRVKGRAYLHSNMIYNLIFFLWCLIRLSDMSHIYCSRGVLEDIAWLVLTFFLRVTLHVWGFPSKTNDCDSTKLLNVVTPEWEGDTLQQKRHQLLLSIACLASTITPDINMMRQLHKAIMFTFSLLMLNLVYLLKVADMAR